MFQVVLVRHAEKDKTQSPAPDDPAGDKLPLSSAGRMTASRLGATLSRKLKQPPKLVFTSGAVHADETAKLIAAQFCPHPPVVPLSILLDPDLAKNLTMDVMAKAASKEGLHLHGNATVILVGHNMQLSELASKMTGKKIKLERAEAICVCADSCAQLLSGSGKFDTKEWPYQEPNPVSGDRLGPKLTGKMTVAGLLAGFTFTALLEMVKDPENLRLKPGRDCRLPQWSCDLSDQFDLPILNVAAILFLTVSLTLFVSAIYIYDSLSMPERFLESPPRKRIPLLGKKTMRYHSARFGFVYAAMIRTWYWIFTPAVVFALLGFILMVARSGSNLVIGLLLAALLAAALYWWREKPGYATD